MMQLLGNRHTKAPKGAPWRWGIGLLCVVACIVIGWVIGHRHRAHTPRAGRQADVTIITVSDIAPTQQLMVMSIYKEILVGKTRRNPIPGAGDYKIYAIYPARMLLGFDLAKCSDDWLVMRGDTLHVTLPPVEILNKDLMLIDEANKSVPIQTGTWTGSDMNDMRHMANQRMLDMCTNEGCWEDATEQGKAIVVSLLEAWGCPNVVVHVEPRMLPPTL